MPNERVDYYSEIPLSQLRREAKYRLKLLRNTKAFSDEESSQVPKELEAFRSIFETENVKDFFIPQGEKGSKERASYIFSALETVASTNEVSRLLQIGVSIPILLRVKSDRGDYNLVLAGGLRSETGTDQLGLGIEERGGPLFKRYHTNPIRRLDASWIDENWPPEMGING